MPAPAELAARTLITVSELAVHIRLKTGLATEYDTLRHRINRAKTNGTLPAPVNDGPLPRHGKTVRRVALEDLDAWCTWFSEHA